MEHFWILLIASLVAINCSLVGSYLVLRKVTMMSDAITHAVLPGIVLGFLITGSKDSLTILVGASSTGILASMLMSFLHTKVKLQSDAAIGITFTWLFALGIILVSLYGRKVDLDPDCVLYGEIAYVPLHLLRTHSGLSIGPQALYTLSIVFVTNLLFIIKSYKELLVTTFDAEFAEVVGIPTTLWHYTLLAITSFTSVAAFEVVGAILVVALFVLPASIAYLFATRVSYMLLLGAVISIVIAVAGYFFAVLLNGSIAGAMATVGGMLFFVCWIIHQCWIHRFHTLCMKKVRCIFEPLRREPSSKAVRVNNIEL